MNRPDLRPVDETADKCVPFALWRVGRDGGFGPELRGRTLGEWAWRPAFAEAWRMDYNECRPHDNLGYGTPFEFAALRAAPEPLVMATS